MISVYDNLKFKVFLLISAVFGVWIPKNSKQLKYFSIKRIWEAFLLTILVLDMWLMLPFYEDMIQKFSRAGELMSNVVFLICQILRRAQISLRKKQLVLIFSKADKLLNTQKMRLQQNKILIGACNLLWIICIAQFMEYFVLMAIMLLPYVVLPEMMQSEKNNGTNSSSPHPLNGVILDKYMHPESFTIREAIAAQLNLQIMIFLWISIIFLDNILYFVSYLLFVEIKALKDELARIKIDARSTVTIGTHIEATGDLLHWIQFFKDIKIFAALVNDFFSFQLTITIALDVLNLCFAAFTAAAIRFGPLMTAMLCASLINLQRVVLLCFYGQKVQTESKQLRNLLSTKTWSNPVLVSTFHLMADDAQNNFLLRGGPFFTLNMEFLTSVVGLVVTYFIVLLQL
ncbi:Hypothetical predicted protein [Cloeon dipterum]|uniref:Odorant receptor n=1 Tax=Cloeon dipterum TaxID=197152 RepID=A0A8S1CYL8_9INSE|nr:Hypothetical predicted protein [Cloeon dipterum]